MVAADYRADAEHRVPQDTQVRRDWSPGTREGGSRYFSAARVFLASSLPEKSAGEPMAALRAFRAFA